jgi:hypothetical protein
MVSPSLRAFAGVLAAAYALLGVILFFAPFWASAHFAWKVSPFVTMTIGGWCLGTAFAAFTIARRPSWPAMLCPILYLALFGLFETGVLIAFRAILNLKPPLAWLYVGTIIATAMFGLAAAGEALMRRREIFARRGPPFDGWALGSTVSFIIVVGFLGLYGLLAVPGMRGLNRGIFPELLSPFSLRAFGAFYFSLALAVTPLLVSRGIGNLVHHGFAMYGLLVTITAAAVVFIGQFDFANRPTQLIYIGIYLLVAFLVGLYLLRHGTGARHVA